ncbi:MAG: helix-turn-helix domain-containing protein [Desulfobulbaceae bacterium]
MNQTAREPYLPFIPQDVAMMVVRGNMPLVKAWRLRLNMTVEEIANAAGMLPDEVIRYEMRENVFSPPLLSVARVMNLDIDQIVDITNSF